MLKSKYHPPDYIPTERENRIAFLHYALSIDDFGRMWLGQFTYQNFKDKWLPVLQEEHCGDCVCVPSSCSRCWAEHIYQLQSTVTWCKSCEFLKFKDCEH